MSRAYADPDCPDCNGLGFIYGASMLDGGRSCHCMMDALKLQNMERIWPSLSKAGEASSLRKKPPLKSLLKRNIWITAKDAVFRAHLKAVAYGQSTMWDARVVTDADLVDTWLATAKAQGHKIFDTEIADRKSRFAAMAINELIEPPKLVILVLGLKQAPNKETHSVVLEAISLRRHLGRPIWVVDQPDHRVDSDFHKAYSDLLIGMMSHWPHIGLRGVDAFVITAGTKDSDELEVVSDYAVDDIVEASGEVEDDASVEIDDALSDLDEEDDEVTAEDEDGDGVEEGEEEIEEEEEDEEEDEEEEGETNPFVQQMMANEEKAEKKAKKKRYQPKKKSFKKGGRR